MNIIERLKELIAPKTQSCVQTFDETASRVKQKSEALIAERNAFAHAAKRMRERGKGKKR